MVEQSTASDTASVASVEDSNAPPAEVITEEGIAKGEEFKSKGNEAFKGKSEQPLKALRKGECLTLCRGQIRRST